MPASSTSVQHHRALVLAEITPTSVALLDPALDDGPTLLSKDGFLLTWEEFDYLASYN
jgi:hypothetical protein